ncbi:hypothetical protein [Oceanobacillus senegalensis]|uniref:hypothetical protein n=1 Tax=Oceanobacillus senegalensis TaxID=1936063 RepID=UPI001FE6C974|nr:hypothetical protein [Oceanobacillus senegalensis]
MSNGKITNEGLWLEKKGKIYKIGLRRELIQSIGAITYLDILYDAKFHNEEPLLHIESLKAAYEISIPIPGEILALNKEALDNPDILNEFTWLLELTSTVESHEYYDDKPAMVTE